MALAVLIEMLLAVTSPKHINNVTTRQSKIAILSRYSFCKRSIEHSVVSGEGASSFEFADDDDDMLEISSS